MAVFADPEGAAFCVWQAKEHKGARIVNEHGSLNFNGLNTRDPEGAKSFYGAVFGWKTLDLAGGAEMWTLPGYGDHLEERNPGLRKQMAEVGGPRRLRGRRREPSSRSRTTSPTSPAHWSVTFGVDDADAIAAKAAELGGKVLVPPFDAPWVRMTVLADPQGATFIASKFVAENKDLGTPGDAASGELAPTAVGLRAGELDALTGLQHAGRIGAARCCCPEPGAAARAIGPVLRVDREAAVVHRHDGPRAEQLAGERRLLGLHRRGEQARAAAGAGSRPPRR